MIGANSVVLVAAMAVVGAILGFAADRLAARWPTHADGTVRGTDWRTAIITIGGGVSFALLATRWAE